MRKKEINTNEEIKTILKKNGYYIIEEDVFSCKGSYCYVGHIERDVVNPAWAHLLPEEKLKRNSELEYTCKTNNIESKANPFEIIPLKGIKI